MPTILTEYKKLLIKVSSEFGFIKSSLVWIKKLYINSAIVIKKDYNSCEIQMIVFVSKCM